MAALISRTNGASYGNEASVRPATVEDRVRDYAFTLRKFNVSTVRREPMCGQYTKAKHRQRSSDLTTFTIR